MSPKCAKKAINFLNEKCLKFRQILVFDIKFWSRQCRLIFVSSTARWYKFVLALWWKELHLVYISQKYISYALSDGILLLCLDMSLIIVSSFININYSEKIFHMDTWTEPFHSIKRHFIWFVITVHSRYTVGIRRQSFLPADRVPAVYRKRENIIENTTKITLPTPLPSCLSSRIWLCHAVEWNH